MEPALYDRLQQSLRTSGPGPAIEELCAQLRQNKDYSGLFYALLMKKRQELGVSPIPTAPSQDLPPQTHAAYEDAIREAVRLVGGLYLEERNIPQAWGYFRMIGEPDAVARAIDSYEPAEGEDVSQLVSIAFQEGVNPCRGFDLILKRFGLCSAITTVSSQEQLSPEARQHCVGRLVHALYEELRDRLRGDIERREGKLPPPAASVTELIAGRDFLFEDDFAHVDTSHLSSVVQMSLALPPTEETRLVRQMCAYGQRISPRLQYQADPPFQDSYRDYGIYLDVILGENVEAGIGHFRQRAEQADPESDGTYPAEVYVNLLLRLERVPEALAAARKLLIHADGRRLSCPSVQELCRRAGDYRALAEVAKEQGDPVHYLAGLIAGNGSPRK
jgi:hypothetical protein